MGKRRRRLYHQKFAKKAGKLRTALGLGQEEPEPTPPAWWVAEQAAKAAAKPAPEPPEPPVAAEPEPAAVVEPEPAAAAEPVVAYEPEPPKLVKKVMKKRKTFTRTKKKS